MSRILRLSPGVLPWHEYDFRQLVRSILLEPSHSDEEYSFWLCQLLKGHPITHQARLLYILTGPTDSTGIFVDPQLLPLVLVAVVVLNSFLIRFCTLVKCLRLCQPFTIQ